MSRVGKKPILIPQDVEVKMEGRKMTVKGPKGELVKEIRPEIEIVIKENVISLSPRKEKAKTSKEGKNIQSFWGLFRALIFNLIQGVTVGFEKKLAIEGIGFKANIEGEDLVLAVGYSHLVRMKIPKELKVSIEKNIVTVSGINKELVGQFAANIRKTKLAEPYKGKGIKYLGEQIRRKVGKKVVATKG